MEPDVRTQPEVVVDGVRYQRAVATTALLVQGDDLVAVIRERLGPALQPGDLVFVSEKAMVVTQGLAVPREWVTVTPLARRLATWVRPTDGSRGLSIPEKMQYVLNEVGVARMLLATALAGLTRPFGLRGAFYVVAGRVARSMDGMRPPFEHLLLPPMPPVQAARVSRELAERLGHPLAIVDVNDRGGTIRAISHKVMTPRTLLRVLADNPLGQRDTRTPIGYVRAVP